MKDYIIIRRYSTLELDKAINEYLEKGYLLAGGVCVWGTRQRHNSDTFYIQAIYKPR